MTLPTDDKSRKNLPIFRGPLMYFPDALLEVARLCKIGNDQHNPGEPMHWARGKSTEQLDTALRHMMDHGTGTIKDTDGVYHMAKAAWRCLAELQLAIEADKGGADLNVLRQQTDDARAEMYKANRNPNKVHRRGQLDVSAHVAKQPAPDPFDTVKHTPAGEAARVVPVVGDRVTIVHCGDGFSQRWVGKVGTVIEHDPSDTSTRPWLVQLDDSSGPDRIWCAFVEPSSEIAAAPSKDGRP